MWKRLAAIILVSMGVAACDLPQTSDQEMLVTAEVLKTSNEYFSPGGAAAGYLLGGKKPLFWVVAGGLAMADGCHVILQVDDLRINLSSEEERCSLKLGSRVTIHKVVRTTTYKDRSKYLQTYYRW